MGEALTNPHGINRGLTSLNGEIAGASQVKLEDNDNNNGVISDSTNFLDEAIGEMTGDIRDLKAGGQTDEKARSIHNLITLDTETSGGITNEAINEDSAVSISNFTDPIVNAISGSAATFDITRLGTTPTVANGQLQGELEVTAGVATQFEQFIFLECDINTMSITSAHPFIQLHRRGTTTLHDIFEIRKESSGNGVKLYVRQGTNQATSVALTVSQIKRPGDPYFSVPSERGVPLIPNPVQGALPTMIENQTFPHFEVGQRIRALIKFEQIGDKLVFFVMLAVYDSSGNWIRTLEMNQTTSGNDAPDADLFDYNTYVFVPGNSGRTILTPFRAIEMWQYNVGNDVGNEIHFPTEAGTRVLLDIDDTHRLRGFYEENRTGLFNIHSNSQANSIKVAAGGEIVFPAWVAGAKYSVGAMIDRLGDPYYCITAHTASTDFDDDAANWKQLGVNGGLPTTYITSAHDFATNFALIGNNVNKITAFTDNGNKTITLANSVGSAGDLLSVQGTGTGTVTIDLATASIPNIVMSRYDVATFIKAEFTVGQTTTAFWLPYAVARATDNEGSGGGGLTWPTSTVSTLASTDEFVVQDDSTTNDEERALTYANLITNLQRDLDFLPHSNTGFFDQKTPQNTTRNTYTVQASDHGKVLAINPEDTVGTEPNIMYVYFPTSLPLYFTCSVVFDGYLQDDALVRIGTRHMIGRPASNTNNASSWVKQDHPTTGFRTVSASNVRSNTNFDFFDLWYANDSIKLTKANTANWYKIDIERYNAFEPPANPSTSGVQSLGRTTSTFTSTTTTPINYNVGTITKFRQIWQTN